MVDFPSITSIRIAPQKRAQQQQVASNAIKTSHLSEPNPYVFSGLAADLPVTGDMVTQGVAIYFETDTGKLKIWNGTTWLQIQLT